MDSGRKLKKYLSDTNPRDLIREVKRRQGLYDKDKLEQPRREHKQQLWMEVAESLTASDVWDEYKDEQKQAKVDEVQHKWKHLRNHFMREVKLIRSGQQHTKRKYIYYNDMEFMFPYVGIKAGRSNVKSNDSMEDSDGDSEENDDEEEEEKSQRRSPRRPVKTPIRKSSPNSNSAPKELTKEQKLVINKFDGLKKISEKIRRPPPSTQPTITQVKNPIPSISMRDGDISFCLSLVPTMRKLEESKRLKAKIDILTILHKYVDPDPPAKKPKVLGNRTKIDRTNDDDKTEHLFDVQYATTTIKQDENESDKNADSNVWWT